MMDILVFKTDVANKENAAKFQFPILVLHSRIDPNFSPHFLCCNNLF